MNRYSYRIASVCWGKSTILLWHVKLLTRNHHSRSNCHARILRIRIDMRISRRLSTERLFPIRPRQPSYYNDIKNKRDTKIREALSYILLRCRRDPRTFEDFLASLPAPISILQEDSYQIYSNTNTQLLLFNTETKNKI